MNEVWKADLIKNYLPKENKECINRYTLCFLRLALMKKGFVFLSKIGETVISLSPEKEKMKKLSL